MATRMKEKSANRIENADRRPRAIARFVRISPFKVRQVLDIIRNKSFVEAMAILKNTNKGSSAVLIKLLNSAAANAENNMGLNRNDLFIAECFADQGPTLKRIRPRAKGRAYRILKRTSHITVILDEMNVANA